MKRKKQETKRLNLSKDTLAVLDPKDLSKLGAGAATILNCCQESAFICSVRHTCVSCQDPTIIDA